MALNLQKEFTGLQKKKTPNLSKFGVYASYLYLTIQEFYLLYVSTRENFNMSMKKRLGIDFYETGL